MTEPTGLRRGWTALALVAVACVACDRGKPGPPPGPPADPAGAALALFQAGRALDAGGDRVPPGLLDESGMERDPVGALELLASLAELSDPRIRSVERLPGLERTAVDVVATVTGGGTAEVSVQVVQHPDGSWRVVAIAMPGRDWPARDRPGTGLSVSAPVGESR